MPTLFPAVIAAQKNNLSGECKPGKINTSDTCKTQQECVDAGGNWFNSFGNICSAVGVENHQLALTGRWQSRDNWWETYTFYSDGTYKGVDEDTFYGYWAPLTPTKAFLLHNDKGDPYLYHKILTLYDITWGHFIMKYPNGNTTVYNQDAWD